VSPSPSRGLPGSIRIQREDGGPVLRLSGEIDVNTVSVFETEPGRDTSLDGHVVAVDAADVTFFSSVGVGFMLRMTSETRQKGRRPIIDRPTRPVLRVLQIAGLVDLFEVRPAPDEGA
jgi:anti-anti-sigma factor